MTQAHLDAFDWDAFGVSEFDFDEYSNLSMESAIEDEDVPEPTELHISTITATAKIVSKDNSGNNILGEDDFLPINLQKFYEDIEVDEVNGPIMSIEYVDNPIKGYDRHKKRKKKRKPLKRNAINFTISQRFLLK